MPGYTSSHRLAEQFLARPPGVPDYRMVDVEIPPVEGEDLASLEQVVQDRVAVEVGDDAHGSIMSEGGDHGHYGLRSSWISRLPAEADAWPLEEPGSAPCGTVPARGTRRSHLPYPGLSAPACRARAFLGHGIDDGRAVGVQGGHRWRTDRTSRASSTNR